MGLSGLTPRTRNILSFTLLGCLAFAVTLYFIAPGWMARDSGGQLAQARSFELRDDHPILMALVWHFTDRIVPGPLGLLVLMVGLYWTGLTAIFASLEGPIVARLLGLLAVGWYPPAAANLPGIWKDNLMHGALFVGIACYAAPGARLRWLRHGLGALAFLLAIGARHNGAAAVWPFLMIPLLALPLLRRAAAPRRWLAAAGAGLGLTLLLTIGVGKALSPLAQKMEFWQLVPVFDLAGMSLAAGEVLVEPETGVLTKGMGLREIRAKYNPRYVNSLYYCLPFKGKRCVPVFQRTVDPVKLERLRANWLSAIARHPTAYLEHRWRVAAKLLGDGAPALYFVEHAPLTAAALEYPPPERARRVLGWVDKQFGSPWFLPWVYVALALALLPVAVVRHARGASALPIFILLSGLSYIASCVLSAGASDFRYTVWTIACSILSLVALLSASAQPRTVRGAARYPIAADASAPRLLSAFSTSVRSSSSSSPCPARCRA